MSQLGCWEGYEVSAQWTERRAGRSWCVIRLEPLRELGPLDLDGLEVIAMRR